MIVWGGQNAATFLNPNTSATPLVEILVVAALKSRESGLYFVGGTSSNGNQTGHRSGGYKSGINRRNRTNG